jgi:hypothetical protein
VVKVINQETCPKHKIPKTLRVIRAAWGEESKLECPQCVLEARERGENQVGWSAGATSGLPWHY